MAHHRFGPGIATQAEPLLTTIADPVRLVDLGDALLSCPDGADWLHVMRQAGATPTAGDKDS